MQRMPVQIFMSMSCTLRNNTSILQKSSLTLLRSQLIHKLLKLANNQAALGKMSFSFKVFLVVKSRIWVKEEFLSHILC